MKTITVEHRGMTATGTDDGTRIEIHISVEPGCKFTPGHYRMLQKAVRKHGNRMLTARIKRTEPETLKLAQMLGFTVAYNTHDGYQLVRTPDGNP